MWSSKRSHLNRTIKFTKWDEPSGAWFNAPIFYCVLFLFLTHTHTHTHTQNILIMLDKTQLCLCTITNSKIFGISQLQSLSLTITTYHNSYHHKKLCSYYCNIRTIKTKGNNIGSSVVVHLKTVSYFSYFIKSPLSFLPQI